MISTDAIHADDHLAQGYPHVAPPIRLSTTYNYPRDVEPPLSSDSLVYSRESHANAIRCEEVLSKILGNRSLVFANGSAAFHAAINTVCPERVISLHPCYGGCRHILEMFERNKRLEILDEDLEKLQKGDLVHIESPVNPSGEARNIQEYAEIIHAKGAYLLVDATFAPPPLTDPFKFGADIVMHSATKCFGGHSDVLGGVLAFKHQELYEQTQKERSLLGTILGPQESWLLLRSLRSYELRIGRQAATALKLVEFLTSNMSQLELLKEVRHSSLQTEPWVKEQVKGGSPTFSIMCTSRAAAKKVVISVKIFHHCTSLGGLGSCVEWKLLADETSPPELVRISVGGENPEDLIGDLKQALNCNM